MPIKFKVFSLLILCARMGITIRCAYIGLKFLMETGGIADLILDSVALVFILELDGMFYKTFAHSMTKDIMSRLQPFEVQEAFHDEQARKIDEETQHECTFCQILYEFLVLGRQIWFTLFITVLAFMVYFIAHCQSIHYPLSKFSQKAY